jgi:hypothetical protein
MKKWIFERSSWAYNVKDTTCCHCGRRHPKFAITEHDVCGSYCKKCTKKFKKDYRKHFGHSVNNPVQE